MGWTRFWTMKGETSTTSWSPWEWISKQNGQRETPKPEMLHRRRNLPTSDFKVDLYRIVQKNSLYQFRRNIKFGVSPATPPFRCYIKKHRKQNMQRFSNVWQNSQASCTTQRTISNILAVLKFSGTLENGQPNEYWFSGGPMANHSFFEHSWL